MLSFRSCLLLLAVCLSQSKGDYPPSSLRHVNLLYRHGDRSPAYIFPNDVNQIDSWPDGLGWLSSIGVRQHHALGEFLKTRYGGFINVSRYNNEEIVIEASAVRRCLMSAYSNLAGLFPPQGDQVWDSDLLWQPIPVLTKPEVEDNKLAMAASCPKYDQLLMETFFSDEVQQYQEENKVFMDDVAKKAGFPSGNIATSLSVCDALICEKAHGMTWNDWVYVEDTYDRLVEISEFGWNLLFQSQEMARLKGGPLLKEMIANMKAATKPESLPKMHMYSAHDSTVSALLSAMMVNNNQRPPYASVVFVELHEMNSQQFVKIFFRNETTDDPHYFLPPGCEDPCKLSTFEEIMKPNIPVDWDKECMVDSQTTEAGVFVSHSVLIAGITVVGTVICVLLAILVVLVYRRHPYSKLKQSQDKENRDAED